MTDLTPYVRKIDKEFQDAYIDMYPESIAKAAQYEHKDERLAMATKNVTVVVTEGCSLRCTYCVSGDTEIKLPDYTTKRIEDIAVGDEVLAFNEYSPGKGRHRKLEIATVTKTFQRASETLLITLEDGRTLNVTDEHPILVRSSATRNAFDYRPAGKVRPGQTVFTLPHVIYSPPDVSSTDYLTGYFVGVVKGDGSLKHYKYPKRDMFKFRIAVKDTEIIDRCAEAMNALGIPFYLKPFLISPKFDIKEDAIFGNTRAIYESVAKVVSDNFGVKDSADYVKGFLAGIYDAEGHIDRKNRTIRICNTDSLIITEISRCLSIINVPFVIEDGGLTKNFVHKWNVRIRDNKVCNTLKFVLSVRPAPARKGISNFHNHSALRKVQVESVERLSIEIPVFNIETTAGTYIANDFAVHNCYQHAKNNNNVLDKETARKIVDLLFEEDARNNKYVNEHIAQALVLDFIGGEPLLNIKTISYFMRYFKWKALQLNHRWAIHYMISISSNGIAYMNPDVQKFLMIHKGRVSITLTLDGNKALHDACRVFPDGSPSYDIVAKATHHAQSVFGLDKGTKLTLAPENIVHLSDAVKNLYESFNFDGVHANCVYELGWEIEHAKIMYCEMKKLADWMLEHEVQKHFYCSLFDSIIGKPQGVEDNQNYCGGLAGTMLAFTTQGNITPCLRYTQFNLNNAQPEIRMGDLETGIGNDPKYDAMIDVVNGITRRSQSTDECFNCPISTGCGWCSAYNYEIYGTPNKRCTSICPMHKARVMANVYFWNSLYRKYNLPDRFACNIPQEWALEIITKDEFDLLEALAEP